MTPVTFAPASSFELKDAQDRQLLFTQKPNGDVEVTVSSEKTFINTVFQENIYVQPPSTEEQQPEPHGLDSMTKDERKMLLRGIKKGLVEVVPADGGISGVKRPNTINNVFFRQIRSLTLKIPS